MVFTVLVLSINEDNHGSSGSDVETWNVRKPFGSCELRYPTLVRWAAVAAWPTHNTLAFTRSSGCLSIS